MCKTFQVCEEISENFKELSNFLGNFDAILDKF